MSYILEALKKSQRERELGQVPRLQASVFDEPREQTRMQRWIIATFALAALAAVLAVYASFRPPAADAPGAGAGMARGEGTSSAQSTGGMPAAPEAEDSVASVNSDNPETEPKSAAESETESAPESAPGKGEELVAAVASAIDHPKRLVLSMADAGADVQEVAGAETAEVEAEVERDVERDPAPQVLAVPAPPKPGERLPRGAEELRRAVLGDDASPADASPLSAQREPARAKAPATQPAPEHVPIPPELIAEIEAFKRSFREEAGAQSASTRTRLPALTPASEPISEPISEPASRPTAKPASSRAEPGRGAATPVSDRPAPLSGRLRRELPPFSMTVHVYDADPARRFIYLNGNKLREGELSRDGFFVEEVGADGAVLRYDAHRFFQSP